MAIIVLLYILFSTTSVQALWLYNTSSSIAQVPEPTSSPPPPPPCSYQSTGPPPPPPCYYQSSGPPPPPPCYYQSGPPPPPPMEYYSSSQSYMTSSMPPMSPMPPMPPMSPMTSSADPMPPAKRPPGKLQDQAQTLSIASQQTYSENELQSSIAMDSAEDISTDDISTSAADEASSVHHLQATSFFERRDSSKPDLSCIIFDDSVCSTTCNQVCQLYNFESTGVCTEAKSCHCTITNMKSPKMDFNQYEKLSLDDLWDLKFAKSTISVKVLNQIKKYPKMTSKVLEMIRKPLRTGDDIKNRLLTAYPDWTILKDLKSRKKSPINRYIDDDYKLDEAGLEKRIKGSVKKYKTDIVGGFSSIDYFKKLTKFLDTVDDEKQLAKILKQIHETKMKSLIKQVKNYLTNRGLDLSIEDLESKEFDYVDADYIDNIVAGAIIKQFVIMISANSSSSKATNKKNSKKAATQQTTSTVTYTENTTTSNQSEQKSSDMTYANVDQCSCPSKKSATKDLDDDSRWILPGFDAYIISDCSGAINEEWGTGDHYIHYTRSASGAYEVVWRKGNDNINIRVAASGAVSQNWYLNGASISLSVAASGAISQSWELGCTSYTYTKAASGSTTRRWRNGTRDQNTLTKYQGYLSAWCSKNYFLVESRHCVIY